MSVLKLIASSSFISVNKHVAKMFGLDAAVLIGELASESEYWRENGELNNGWFYSTIENVEEKTTLSAHKQRKALSVLQDAGIIEVEYKGLPKKRHIRINERKLLNAVGDNSQNSSITNRENFEPLDIENLNVNKKEEEEYTNNKKDMGQKRKRFVPPTIEEVTEYCNERGNTIDPQRFIDYYETRGWMVGKNKMKSWKAAVRTWEGNEFGNSKPKKEMTYDEMVGDTEEWPSWEMI